MIMMCEVIFKASIYNMKTFTNFAFVRALPVALSNEKKVKRSLAFKVEGKKAQKVKDDIK